MMKCEKCGGLISEDSAFCPLCGGKVAAGSNSSCPAGFMKAGNLTDSVHQSDAVETSPVPIAVTFPKEDRRTSAAPLSGDNAVPFQSPNQSTAHAINFFSLMLIVVCLVAWFSAPFMAINILTLGDQPTALELLQEDVIYIGDLKKTEAYEAAMVSIIGISICAVCVLCESAVFTRVVAACTLYPISKNIIDAMRLVDNSEEVQYFFGAAYWIIFASLILILIFGGRR